MQNQGGDVKYVKNSENKYRWW